jgi:hypothetical protein
MKWLRRRFGPPWRRPGRLRVFGGGAKATTPENPECLAARELDSPPFKRILLLLFLASLVLVNPIVHGDGVGYYAYARAPLIEHGLDFTHDYQTANEGFREGRLDDSGQPKADFRTPTGHLDNHFSVGPALLWSPFLLVAHAGVLLAREFGSSVRADGFSAPYRYAMAFGTAIYGFLALLLAFQLTRKYVDPRWAFIATLTIWWASSLPVYMYFNPSWSHAHSAFTAALFLWYWERTHAERTLRQWIILGLIAGLMLNVYYPNLLLFAVVASEALWHFIDFFRSPEVPKRNTIPSLVSCQFLFGVVVCACLTPTFASRWIVYGGPFKTGYLSIHDFLWGSPVFLKVLFSANHGLLSWTPVLSLSLLGLVLFVRRLPRIGGPFLAGAVAYYLFISFYPDWAGIASFGNRFFISLTALFVFGLAITLETLTNRFSSQRVALLASTALLACVTLWNLGLIYQWGTHLIPARGPISFSQAASNQFHVVPRQISADLQRYFFKRRALMQQIEQKDVEQLNKDTQP